MHIRRDLSRLTFIITALVALKKWFRNLHLLNIHVMLLGQEGRLAAIDTVQEFLCELDMKPHMDLLKKIIEPNLD